MVLFKEKKLRVTTATLLLLSTLVLQERVEGAVPPYVSDFLSYVPTASVQEVNTNQQNKNDDDNDPFLDAPLVNTPENAHLSAYLDRNDDDPLLPTARSLDEYTNESTIKIGNGKKMEIFFPITEAITKDKNATVKTTNPRTKKIKKFIQNNKFLIGGSIGLVASLLVAYKLHNYAKEKEEKLLLHDMDSPSSYHTLSGYKTLNAQSEFLQSAAERGEVLDVLNDSIDLGDTKLIDESTHSNYNSVKNYENEDDSIKIDKNIFTKLRDHANTNRRKIFALSLVVALITTQMYAYYSRREKHSRRKSTKKSSKERSKRSRSSKHNRNNNMNKHVAMEASVPSAAAAATTAAEAAAAAARAAVEDSFPFGDQQQRAQHEQLAEQKTMLQERGTADYAKNKKAENITEFENSSVQL